MFSAIINTPGYLSEQEEVPLFDTAREAWKYLETEYQQQCDGIDAYARPRSILQFATAWQQNVSGYVYTSTPGIGHDNDLGRVFSVTDVPNPWIQPEPAQNPESVQCSSCGQDWSRTDLAEAVEHTRYSHPTPSDLLAAFYTIIDTKGL
ncbi:hypothetical protein [Frigoribacterium sp. CG_9.8]|uniref:hypothetical protein n=1 Tax=Frigoribacterium sp. CG_9.8 TaxID=2787733 RepID=UPI0018C961A5|nr:hypothetical protein [Frigoribacterium sp. CG_9.8]MBG6106577.1 hypothetical protein [Frigoribacterium sp. CG_9.8]